MLKTIEQLLNTLPFELTNAALIAQITALGIILLSAAIVYFIAKYFVVRSVNTLIDKSTSKLDDILVKRNVFGRIALLAPAIVIYKLTPEALKNNDAISSGVLTLCLIYAVIIAVLIIDTLIDSIIEIYYQSSKNRHLPVKSFAQVCKLITYFFAVILIISFVIGESPLKLFAGLGAMAAVLMLVFKDPILGFVAGIQLSSNKMVGIGDWVEIPQHNADGDILEIGLTTVKVRNFDNTITTVPTQSLINDSFKNWRGMQESGGRRIKRSIHIDINSIQFCDETMLERYSRVKYISDYLQAKQDEVAKHNQEKQLDLSSLANGRRLTNIGTFRAYIEAYLNQHPDIHQGLTLLVRQLEPSNNGLPIQIYVFSREKNWIKYESIQADIFDHLIAVSGEFDLKIFQQPSGNDFYSITRDSSLAAANAAPTIN